MEKKAPFKVGDIVYTSYRFFPLLGHIVTGVKRHKRGYCQSGFMVHTTPNFEGSHCTCCGQYVHHLPPLDSAWFSKKSKKGK